MSSYNFDHIIRECLEEKATNINTARGKSVGAKIDIYANSWVALNAWIESRLAQQKGASIAGFGSFCWEMLEKDGETHCRPLFLLDENFVKLNRVKRKRIHYPPQLTPVEEINFSLLAIKFSKSLTKDMIFNGLRDITRKIGDFVQRGYQFEIEFTFGILSAKENRVKFTFNQQRLIDILPENAEAGIYRHNDKPLKFIETEVLTERSEAVSTAGTETGTAGRSSPVKGFNASKEIKKPTVPTLDFAKKRNAGSVPQEKTFANSLSFTSLNDKTQKEIVNNGEFKAGDTFNQTNSSTVSTTYLDSPTSYNDTSSPATISAPPPPVLAPASASASASYFSTTKTIGPKDPIPPNPELRAVLDAIGNRESSLNKTEFRQRAKERVIAQAFTRCLDEVEDVAKTEDFRRYEERKLYEAWRATENQKKEKLNEQSKLLKDSLDKQLEFSRTKHQEEKNERKNTMINYLLPESPSIIPVTYDANGQPIDRRKVVSKELRQQIEQNLQATKQKRNESVQEERELINKITLENELNSILQRADHLDKQKALLEAWEQDGHIRNLKKLQAFGKELVTDYIDRNLVEINSTMHTFSPNLNQSLNKSIGYDLRKGKF